MKRLLIIVLLAANALPTAPAYGKGVEAKATESRDDVNHGVKELLDEFGSTLTNVRGLPGVNCEFKDAKGSVRSVAGDAGSSQPSKRGT